ncbi:hypothetical protein PsorP6_008401 [Peronosclerospora sorghi]|uniref:Uncharacterized protein n=1 Tax=Peronosclerospora sorghi TaxID=230839 RepID=A0ACC0WB58_9STRA|nr:hypothetical protein PsorP6_008401 [Peronosclerospora sorghi]
MNEYGLIEVKYEEKSEETVELTEQDKVENNSNFRCDVIRFTFDSMANNDVETREDEKHDSDRSRTKLFRNLGMKCDLGLHNIVKQALSVRQICQ